MLDELIERQLEPNRISSVDIVDLGLSTSVGGAFIAAKVVGVDDIVRERWHV